MTTIAPYPFPDRFPESDPVREKNTLEAWRAVVDRINDLDPVPEHWEEMQHHVLDITDDLMRLAKRLENPNGRFMHCENDVHLLSLKLLCGHIQRFAEGAGVEVSSARSREEVLRAIESLQTLEIDDQPFPLWR
jgi:hypothetical protein